MLIEATPPAQTVSWNYQLNNHWMESLDYRCVHTLSTQNGGRAVSSPARVALCASSSAFDLLSPALRPHYCAIFLWCPSMYVRRRGPYCRYYQIHVNKGKAVTLPDGRIRIIVASVNPGIARTNWVDTAGHDFGTCCFRWITPYPSSPTMSEREETSMADGGVHQPSCRLFETQEALTKHLLDNKAI